MITSELFSIVKYKGSFIDNFFSYIISDAPMAWLGTSIAAVLPNVAGAAINYDIPFFAEALYIGGIGYQPNDFMETGCSSTRGGWIGSDVCN